MVTYKIMQQMYAASILSRRIEQSTGTLKPDYKKEDCYKDAHFQGDVFSVSGGPSNINAGLVGVVELQITEEEMKKTGLSNTGIVVAFRGTEGLEDWKNNAALVQKDWPYPKGKVHTGFSNSFDSLREKITTQIDTLVKNHPNADIYVTGHSKGGALATLMGSYLHTKFKDRVRAVTFASPRVGNEEFSNNYMVKHYRIESFLDLVCHMPFTAQEHTLFPRHNPIYGSAIITFLKSLLDAAPYVPVGQRYAFKHKGSQRDRYLSLPMESDNSKRETLNSFVSILRALDEGKLMLVVNDVHNDDYDHIPPDIFKA